MRVLHWIIWIIAIGSPGICFQAYDRVHNTAISRVTPDKVLVGSRELYSIVGFGGTTYSSGSGVQYSATSAVHMEATLLKSQLRRRTDINMLFVLRVRVKATSGLS
jgi:hypothetical protein